jgi:ATP sulfurylase
MEEEKLTLLKEESKELLSISLNHFQLSDLELILNGSYFPLQGFLNQDDYDR